MDKNYQILSVEQEKDFLLKHLSEVIKREEEKDEFEGIDRVTYTITLFKNKTEDYNYNQTILFKYDSSIELKVVKDKGNASYFLNGFCFRCFGSTSVLGADGILLQLSDEAKLHYGEAVQITFLTGDKKRIETENYKEISKSDLVSIFSDGTKFRANYGLKKSSLDDEVDDYYTIEGIVDHIYPNMLGTVDFFVNDGNISEEDIDKLYLELHEEIENKEKKRLEEEEKTRIAEESRKKQETQVQNTPANNSSGCYVATAVYGSYDCPEVWTLRRFRDNTLDETWYGRLFIKMYYAVSPILVKWFGKTKWFRKLWKSPLDRMVRNLQKKGVASTPYNDKY